MRTGVCVRGISTLVELARVVFAVPRVELERRRLSLHHAVTAVRRRSSYRVARSTEARRRLRRAIALVDARLPDGPNCVRRSLLEMALDGGAAREKLMAGFVSGGGRKSGHAWLETESVAFKYDAVISI
jgi:hypothetical protein